MYGLVKGCRDWSKGDGWDEFPCVWGALSTVIGLGIGGRSAYNTYTFLNQRLADCGWNILGVGGTRGFSDIYEVAQNYNLAVGTIIGRPVATELLNNGSFARSEGYNTPIHVVELPGGQWQHLTIPALNETHVRGRVQTETTTLQHAKRDEQFNLENISEGGIEGEAEQANYGGASLDIDCYFLASWTMK